MTTLERERKPLFGPHIAPVIHCSSFCLGAAPTWREAISPFLNSIRVGIDMTPYLEAVCGFSSTLSLTILTLPLSDPEISSSAGAIMRQGPHHSAQKSTTTAPLAFNTSESKSASETLPTAMRITSFCLPPENRPERSALIGERNYERGVKASRRAHREVRAWSNAS